MHNHPFKIMLLKEQFGDKFYKLGIEEPIVEQKIKSEYNSKNFKKGKNHLKRMKSKERYRKLTYEMKQAEKLLNSISNVFCQKTSYSKYCWKSTFSTKCAINSSLKRYNLGELKFVKEISTSLHKLTRKKSGNYIACFKYMKKLRSVLITKNKIDKEIPNFIKIVIFKKFDIGLFEVKFSRSFKKKICLINNKKK